MGDLLFRPAESDNDYEDTKKTAADICGLEDTKFIIPKSGTHFVEVVSLKDKVSVDKVKPLREVCKNGDHYLAQFYPTVERGQGSNHMETGAFSSFVHKVFLLATSISEPLETMSYMYEVVDARRTNATHFYVIKGNSCVKVDNLTDPMTLFSQRESIFTLHQECQGGDFYLANRAGFYIIRSKDNTYLHVRDMSEKGYHPSFASRQKLHESFANGLCYFATEDYFYVLKENAVFGLVYHRTKDLRISDDDVLTVSPSIVKFMKNSPLDEASSSESATQLLPPQPAKFKPNSRSLSVIKWMNESEEVETFQLKSLVFHKWKDIGNLFVPRQLLDAWAREKDLDAKGCCDKVFSYWLDNPPRYYPVTWEGLYVLLNDSELGQVATDLKQAVDNAI